MDFTHLHCHTQFSLLDGAAKIQDLISNVKQMGMNAIAITDHGNMYGVPQFVAAANKQGIKPIIGCEFYVAPGSRFDTKIKAISDPSKKRAKYSYHQLILAKNETGYKNITRLSSLGFTEGFYYKPRIDLELIKKYSEGLIATTCCLAGHVPATILYSSEQEAEKVFLEWYDIFGDDYYIELHRHGIKEQEIVNEILLKLSKKHNVKVIATNDIHYIDQKDAIAQDILLCLNTGKEYDDPNRMRFKNDNFYLKTPDEMAELFEDIHEALENTNEIVEKVQLIKLERDVLLPIFKLPEGFVTEDDYLKHLAFQGVNKRYGTITDEISSRLEYELKVIKTMGYAGYFLIVQDFIVAARKLDVKVGPGRGSAAGSVVAYCTGVTNIDPIKYNLLFERFLNPERTNMPDIDIDFDDVGRQKVIDYVVKKYGHNQVAQLITFGSMGAKTSIRDVARILGVPLSDANYLAKLVLEKPDMTLDQAYQDCPELAEIKNSNSLRGKVLQLAETVEGSPRHTGIHAAGIIIAPGDLHDLIPLCTSKESKLLVTQYDGSEIEHVGMLKMDFLGLKTLTIIKDALELIKKNHGVEIDIENIPLDDEKTFQLYQRGDTIGTFQFESEGMRTYLKELKPTCFEDLIAMNALYRPGPMQFIPNYIKRKHGKEKVEYPHPLLEGILKNTYGIMVYQEQIMQAAQIIADYSLGEADVLRRIMGKKKPELLPLQEEKFIKRAMTKEINEKKAKEIFDIMAEFAGYGFNRSHSAAYSMIAFQTAYLKAHYPAEYMAAVLTNNINNIDKVTFFIDECKRQNIEVLGPDLNESNIYFDINKDGKIRFGLAAIKGTGEAAAMEIISKREIRNPKSEIQNPKSEIQNPKSEKSSSSGSRSAFENGLYKDIFDFAKRINLRTVTKKTFESLALAGSFDCFSENHRAQYFHIPENGTESLIEKTIKYGNTYQKEKNTAQQYLFANDSGAELPTPKIAECEPWGDIEKLRLEKEVVGFYISGHPLDQFKLEMDTFCTCAVDRIENFKNRSISVAGIVIKINVRQGKNGQKFALVTIEDFIGKLDFALFGENYLEFSHLLNPGEFLFIKGNVALRYNSDDKWDLKPQSIQLLSEIRTKLCKALEIQIDLKKINETMLKEIEQITHENPGKCELRFSLYEFSTDPLSPAKSPIESLTSSGLTGQMGHTEDSNGTEKSENSDIISVELLSRKMRVNPNNEFTDKLNDIDGVSYKLIP